MPNALAFAAQILQMLPAVIRGVQGARDAMIWGADQIKTMVAEHRDPTEAEWDALNTMTSALGDELMSDG